MLADGIGHTFGLHLTGALVFALLRLDFLFFLGVVVVQGSVSDLMDSRLDVLHLGHALVDCDTLFGIVAIALCAGGDFLKAHGERGRLL